MSFQRSLFCVSQCKLGNINSSCKGLFIFQKCCPKDSFVRSCFTLKQNLKTDLDNYNNKHCNYNKYYSVVITKKYSAGSSTGYLEIKLDNFFKHLTIHNLKSSGVIENADNQLLLGLFKQKKMTEEQILQLKAMKDEENTKKDQGMLELIEIDILQLESDLKYIYKQILDSILPGDDFENCNDILLEISAGVGGSEAMLFASELQNMYCGYLDYKKWSYFVAENDESESGGLRHCSLLVTGPKAYRILQHEAGVHRVQRVPQTEKAGRMHTSTVNVAILPQPSDVEVNIKESDLKIERKRAKGAGGQHVNTTESAIRITHLPTGIVVECQSQRSQIQNKAAALKQLRAKIYEKNLLQVDSSIRSQRKLQIGTSSRSEKIRTYNFRDDRITDHRLSINVYNLKKFLEGSEYLDKLLTQLEEKHYKTKVQKFIDNLQI